MDPTSDLSLLEISGEDDSLLLSDASTSANLFSCSPLVSLRSRPRQIKGSESDGVDSEDVISSPKDSANKENANCIKPEAPKLNVEPQQMKRKKKLGGYNLRKSLAWDRAFFTEQGVLNPLELSMISGTATPNAKSNLDVIDEEEPALTSSALQEIEENLFKQSSEGVPIRDKKIGAGSGLSPKPGALIKQTPPRASLAKRKVIAANDVGNRSKRSAFPRPAPSSSTGTVTTPSKETKITRIPGPKSNVSANATTTRSGILSSGSAKRNQNAHLATNAQTSAGVKGQSKIPRTVPIIPKFDLANKYSVTRTLTKQDGKHLDNSVSKTCPPSRLHQTGSGANKVSGGCIPQGVPDTGNKKQQTLLQTTKSSGLRMPSPSLGYFSQAKASNSQGQLQKSSIPCKPSASNIPKPRKLETIAVKEARSKIVEEATNNCTKELSISDVKSEPSMQIDNKQMAGLEVECYSLGFEKISKQAEVINILKHVNLKSKEQRELHENEKVSSMVFPTHEKEVFTKSRTHEQLEKEADHTLDDKFNDVLSNGDQSLYQQPQSMHCFITQSTSSNISNTVHNAIAQDEDDQIKGPTCDILTFKESVVLQEEHGTSFKDSRHSGEFKEYNSVKTALSNSSLNDFSKTVPVRFIQGTPCKNTESVNGGAGEFGRCGGDGQVHLLNEGLSINCNETSQSNLEAVNQQLQGGQLKAPHPSIVGDTGSEKENESDMNSCQPVHVTTLFSKGAPEKSILEINGASENESKITEIKDCQLPVDSQSCFIPRRPMDEEYDQVIDSKEIHDRTQEFELDRLSEDCRTVSAASCCTNVTNVSPERRPFPENNVKNLHLTPEICPTVNDDCDNMPIKNSSTTPQSQIRDDNFSMDTSIHCEVQCDVSGNLEQQASILTYPEINEIPWKNESLVPNHDHLLHQSEFAEVCADVISNTENSDCSRAENSSCLLQHTPLTQSVQEFDHTYKEIEESHEEDAQTQSFNENPEAYDCSSKHCLAVTNDQFALSDCNNINEDSHLPEFQKPSAVVAQDSQNVDNILHLDSDCLPTIIVSCAEIKEQNLVKGAFEGCRFDKNEHDASNHHTYRKIEESHEEDSQGQSFIENPIAYDCSSKHCLAVTNIIKEDSHLHEFQKLSAVVALDSQFVNNILQVDSDCLPTNIASSAEIKEQNLVDGAFEGCRFHTKENDASNSNIQDMPENKDGNDFVDERMELLQIDGAEEGSSDILPLVEVQLNDNVISAEFDSSIEVSEDPFTSIVACESEDQCFLSEKSKLLASDNPTFDATIPHGSEVSSGAFEGCRFHTKENNASNSHIQIMPENKDENDFVDERMELLQIDGAEDGSSDILPLVEVQLNDNVISAEFDSSIEVSEDPFTSIVACESEDGCFLSEKSKLLASDNPTFDATIPHGSEVSSGAFEGCRFHTKENDASNSHIQIMPENKDGNDFVDERMELLQIDGAEEGSSDILPLVEVQLNDNVISAEFDSSIEVSEDPFTSIVACESEDQCFLSEKSKLLASDNPTFDATIPHGSEVSSGAFEGCRFHTKENDASNSHIQIMPENKDGNDFVDERMELLQIDGAEEGSSDILPLVEVQLNDNVISAEFDSSIEVSEDPFTSIVACESEDQCCLSEKSKLLASDNPTFDATIPHGSEVSSGAFEGYRFHTKENDASNSHIQDMPENKDGNDFVDERMELLQIDGAEEGSSDILPLVEVQLNDNVISAEFDSSIEVSEDPFTSIVACESEDQCFLSEKSKLLASDNPTFDATIPHGSEVSSVNSRSFSDVAETNIIIENEKFPNTNMPCQTKDIIDLPEDNSKIIHLEKSPKRSRQEIPAVKTVKPPPNAAPFTEEWLAAIEAAGEEILTMKSGAVQNSPPDKAQPEPSPWSPVKKNQAIGPFDCTKHNIQHSTSPS